MPRLLLFFLLCHLSLAGEKMPAYHATTAAAVRQAHERLWQERVDGYGIIHDYVGQLPTAEDCEMGRPNAIGWWSPIEDGPMFTGLYLPAVCERASRSAAAEDKAKATRLALGLLKCASVSDVPGFIARGIGADGSCHYPLGSDDQTHPWFYGLHAYCMSGIPSATERAAVVAKMQEVAAVLESTGWRCPADGAFKGDFRGSYKGHLFRDAVRYLYLLRAMHEVTQDGLWLQRYEKALMEKPEGSAETRLQICAEGYARDQEAIKGIHETQQWIYVGSQASLAMLLAMEKDEARRGLYRQGLVSNAQASLLCLQSCQEFDNKDAKVFGNADWRAVYDAWFPQITQADAERLSQMANKVKRGERKHYEARFMQNPLAAAAIVALAGDGMGRQAVESAIRHYDYGRIYLSTFFFAECAYYALPGGE